MALHAGVSSGWPHGTIICMIEVVADVDIAELCLRQPLSPQVYLLSQLVIVLLLPCTLKKMAHSFTAASEKFIEVNMKYLLPLSLQRSRHCTLLMLFIIPRQRRTLVEGLWRGYLSHNTTNQENLQNKFL